jgi:hypothetical protein
VTAEEVLAVLRKHSVLILTESDDREEEDRSVLLRNLRLVKIADWVNERINNLADASDANWEAACRATERAEAAKRELTALKAQWDAVGKGLPAEEK